MKTYTGSLLFVGKICGSGASIRYPGGMRLRSDRAPEYYECARTDPESAGDDVPGCRYTGDGRGCRGGLAFAVRPCIFRRDSV